MLACVLGVFILDMILLITHSSSLAFTPSTGRGCDGWTSGRGRQRTNRKRAQATLILTNMRCLMFIIFAARDGISKWQRRRWMLCLLQHSAIYTHLVIIYAVNLLTLEWLAAVAAWVVDRLIICCTFRTESCGASTCGLYACTIYRSNIIMYTSKWRVRFVKQNANGLSCARHLLWHMRCVSSSWIGLRGILIEQYWDSFRNKYYMIWPHGMDAITCAIIS